MMVRSYPKVNLALDILGKDANGFHFIQTVLHELPEPFDELVIEETDEDRVKVIGNHKEVPMDSTNSVVQAAEAVKKKFLVARGVTITITKNIPVGGGNGGHSSNAAATLKALAHLWNLPCCRAKIIQGEMHSSDCILFELARTLTTDCAFFINGGTAFATHYGELIEPLPRPPQDVSLSIIETNTPLATSQAYSWVDQLPADLFGKKLHMTERLVDAIKKKNSGDIVAYLHNDFETAVFEKLPQLEKFLQEKDKIILCGSGGNLVRCVLSGNNNESSVV